MRPEDHRMETVRARVRRLELRQIQTIAARRGITVSDVVREALDAYLMLDASKTLTRESASR